MDELIVLQLKYGAVGMNPWCNMLTVLINQAGTTRVLRWSRAQDSQVSAQTN